MSINIDKSGKHKTKCKSEFQDILHICKFHEDTKQKFNRKNHQRIRIRTCARAHVERIHTNIRIITFWYLREKGIGWGEKETSTVFTIFYFF